MPIYTTTDASNFLKTARSVSRSLLATKFCQLKTKQDGSGDESYRSKTAEAIAKGNRLNNLTELNQQFTEQLLKQGAAIIYAKTEARLILNAAGGVIENGGISLDRNSSLPIIPGSAIKGCARRYAIWQLSQENDPAAKANMLTQICLSYGYGDTEWKVGRKQIETHPFGGYSHSDFWLAMTPLEDSGNQHDAQRDKLWQQVSTQTQQLINEALGCKKFPKQLSGSIAFLPAVAHNDPNIEPDIITCHHQDYYAGKQSTATDDENPNPVIFPTIAKGASFQFLLSPCTSFATTDLLEFAKKNLTDGLQIFGLGAKTNAGYGWFSLDTIAQNKADTQRKEKQQAIQKEQKLNSMSSEERTEFELKELDYNEFVEICKNIENESNEKQIIVCNMLATNKKLDWKNWKKAKKWKPRIPTIKEIASKHNITLS